MYLLLYTMHGQPFVVDWTLGFCPLWGWLVATVSALRPQAYSDPLASGLSLFPKKGDWDRQVSQLRLVSILSAQRFIH